MRHYVRSRNTSTLRQNENLTLQSHSVAYPPEKASPQRKPGHQRSLAQKVPPNSPSELKLETTALQAVVVLFVEAVFDRRTGPMARSAIVHL